ncbi:MAG: DNA translocase FtsK [Firmicutes bacterium]|nr:DNA translocase FtsK [Bacillota bacterium]
MADTKKKTTGKTTGSKNTTTSSAKTTAKTSKPKSKAAETRAKNKAEREKHKEEILRKSRIHDEIWAVVLIALGVFLAVSIQTAATGIFGAALKSFLMGSFGLVAHMLPYYLILYGILLFAKQAAHIGTRSAVCLILIFLMIVVINSSFHLDGTEEFGAKFMAESYKQGITKESAGVVGMMIGLALVTIIGKTGLWIFCGAVIVVCLLLLVNTPISAFFDNWKAHRQAVKKEREEAAVFRAEEAEKAAKELERAKREAELAQKAADAKRRTQTLPPVSLGVQETMDLKPMDMTPLEIKPMDLNPAAEPKMKVHISGEISESQKQILELMKDDTLFESRGVSEGLGLEAATPVEPGKGLTPIGVSVDQDSVWQFNQEHTIMDTELGEAIKEAVAESGVLAPVNEREAAALLAAQNGGAASDMAEPLRPKKDNGPVEPLEISTETTPIPQYQYPPLDLLNKPSRSGHANEKASLEASAQKLEETLHNFNVNASVVQVTKGPTVTRYEIQPAVGVKFSSIVRLADDIALNLAAKSIRIEAPIPGKAAVGIEVENDKINMVTIREIIDSKEFKDNKSKISFAVGKDIGGKAIVTDLKSMPHLLIAGSTGSGKSVCINSLICSILYHATPEEVKFILIDPKVVELSNYNGIPHLLIPVVTEPKKAAAALNWAVAEMNERYKKFAETGVRDLASYNEKVKAAGENDKFMPQIVIIIDELADLMIAAPSQVEESINRLAALARAAGMHLVVATQRPSVDVITGVIKANIGSRIAFAVSSQFDSRTILDMAGAEKLVGKGDMLFAPMGQKPTRVQGCFISDAEVHGIIDFLKNQAEGKTDYAQDVIHSIERANSGTNEQEEEVDELLTDAIELVVQAEQASVSMLQRRFRIGYNRAARLVDMMEARGIIGPADGSRPRKVLIDMADLAEMQAQAIDDSVPEEI